MDGDSNSVIWIICRYIFWNKGGFGWSIGKKAYLMSGSHWHRSKNVDKVAPVSYLWLFFQVVLTQRSLGRGTGRMGCRWSARGAKVLTASGLGSLSGLTAQ